MARYFFDIYDGGQAPTIDTDGHDFDDLAAVRGEVLRLLPEIAAAELAEDGDRRSFVVVRDAQRTIYSATLTYTGVWHLG